ncbi:unnamed protein product, partial [Meganyctiphanes norvegica]
QFTPGPQHARMLSYKVIFCGLLILVVQWYQAEAACSQDEHGNSLCTTGKSCNSDGTECVSSGGRPQIGAGGNCTDGEFNCGKFCIPASIVCDGEIDCGNGSDEPDYCNQIAK